MYAHTHVRVCVQGQPINLSHVCLHVHVHEQTASLTLTPSTAAGMYEGVAKHKHTHTQLILTRMCDRLTSVVLSAILSARSLVACVPGACLLIFRRVPVFT